MDTRQVSVAAIQLAVEGWDREANVAHAEQMVRDAAARGAQVILLPELFELPYFCTEQEGRYLLLAEPISENPTVARFRKVAAELGVVLPISVYERAGQARFNTVAMIDADGSLMGSYRKTHIPDGPGYSEKYYFTPGDTGFQVWDTRFGRIGVGICWDQWFPECARAMALKGAQLILYPTAIGSEPQDATLDSRDHWQRTMQGHAAANLTPVIAANRIGTEHVGAVVQTYYGSSFLTDQRGAKLVEAGRTEETILIQQYDLAAHEGVRASWGLFRDRRPTMYGSLRTSDGVLVSA